VFVDETLLGMHVNILAYVLLLMSAVTGLCAAASHQRVVRGSGLDTDDSPSGWFLCAVCLFLVAGMLPASSSGIQKESEALSAKAYDKYDVTYVEESARSQIGHLVTSKSKVKALVDGQEAVLSQVVDSQTNELTLSFYGSTEELPRR